MYKVFKKQPPRYKQDYALYFLTFYPYKRMKILHKRGIAEFIIKELKFYSKKIKNLIAYTVMPDHVHLLVEVDKSSNLSDFLRDFKKYTSKEIKSRLNIKTRYIWQRGTMDHCIRDDYDFLNHLTYIFYNCEKHINTLPKKFKYHNFKKFVKSGYFDINFYYFDDRVIKNKE